MVILYPILNIKSRFPQNMLLDHLFPLLRKSDPQKVWDGRGGGNILKSIEKMHLHRVLQSEFLTGKKFYFKFTGGIYK